MVVTRNFDTLDSQEWRTLGFFYDRDRQRRQWRIRGSKKGLRRFAQILIDYAKNEYHATLSEHEHYGPYKYLKIMTWDRPGMDENSIHGSLYDLRRLADLVLGQVDTSSPGESRRIREEYAPDAEYSLVLEVRGDNFDPASPGSA